MGIFYRPTNQEEEEKVEEEVDEPFFKQLTDALKSKDLNSLAICWEGNKIVNK